MDENLQIFSSGAAPLFRESELPEKVSLDLSAGHSEGSDDVCVNYRNMFLALYVDMSLMGCSACMRRTDQHGWRVIAGCAGVGVAFIAGSQAAVHRA